MRSTSTPGWRLGPDQITLPHKKPPDTETKSSDSTQTEKVAVETEMMLLGQSLQEAQKPIGPVKDQIRKEQDKTGWAC